MMRCTHCDTPNVQHGNPICATWARCTRCGGTAGKPDASDTMGSWAPIRIELCLCDVCAIREERARAYVAGRLTDIVIINGSVYTPDQRVPVGQNDPDPGGQWRGMGGRRFDIERLNTGEQFSCYSLWHGGEVGDHCKERMPDNARFLNGAERIELGSTVCFNESSATTE